METNFQTVLPFKNDIESSRYQPIECFSQIPRYLNGSLDFYIEPSTTEYINLKDSFLAITLKGVSIEDNITEKPLDGNVNIGYEPFIGQTLFKQINLSINDEEISRSWSNLYDYETMIKTLVFLSKEDIKNKLGGAGVELQDSPNLGIDDISSGMNRRKTLCKISNTFATPILWSIFQTSKLLPTNVEMKLQLVLNSPERCLIVKDLPPSNIRYDIKIEKATLYLLKTKLTSPAMSRAEKMLTSTGFKYPLLTYHTINFMVETGSTERSRILLYPGNLPRMVFVYQVFRKSIENMQEPTYNFNHFDVSSIFLECDNTIYPMNLGYNTNFDSNNIQGDQFKLYQSQINYSNTNSEINEKTWEIGKTIFPFSFIPDLQHDDDHINSNQTHSGPLFLHIKWKNPLIEPVAIFVTFEQYGILKLNNKRKPDWIK